MGTDDLRTYDLCAADVLDTDLHHAHLHNADRGDHRRRADGLCATGRGDVCAHLHGADLHNASRRNLRATDDFRTSDLCAVDVLDADLHHAHLTTPVVETVAPVASYSRPTLAASTSLA